MQVDTLGRYRIDKELGRGAMGRVFLAYDPTIDRRVAIKTIQIFAALPAAERDAARERFLREARAAGKLLHPGIVTVFDVGEAEGVPYLAMEYVQGRTLDAFCRPDALLPVPTVVALVAGAAEALAFAHKNGIVHRDVKPGNLMRVGDSGIKVMDFGLAKGPASSMTHDGALLGTPNYMSPEQIRGETLDGRSDLFSLAVVLYELLTGEKPFSGDSVSSVLYRIVHEPPRAADLHLERVPPPLAAFLARALSKAPDARFQDGAAFVAALRRAGAAADEAPLAHRPASSGDAAAVTERASQKAPRRWPYMVGAAVVIAGVGLLVLGLPGRRAPVVPASHATVRTEPPGGTVLFDGKPVDQSGLSFPAGGPFGLLTATLGCREVKHRLEAADAGREIVLAADPLQAEITVDPGAPGARVRVNGREAGNAPITVTLDLCRENTIEAGAVNFRSAEATIRAQATPLEARNAAAAMRLEPLPMGRLSIPAAVARLHVTVDGQPTRAGNAPMEIPAGRHAVRAVDDERFLDVAADVDVPEGGTVEAPLAVPAMARLVVQTFPPNCRVELRRSGAAWRAIGEAPLRRDVAPGRYDVRVAPPEGGEPHEESVSVRAGDNPPVRISFGRPAR